ncbi:MAG TPA: thioredoxin [Candidatus Nanoarchaeia archaeon]|nr:thioredoxin [Candidatus Nanoarchaeia archaeon]
MVTELNEDNFDKMTKKGKAVVDFYADWCGPCQMMKPIFEKVGKEIKGVNFFKVNVDNCQEAAASYDVRSIPTLVFLKDGKEVDRVMGVLYEEELKKKIAATLK